MRLQRARAALGGLVFFTAAAFAQNGPTVWDLNGSQLYLSASGTKRELRYHTVRPGLQEAGVQPGTLWFQGTRSGDQYSGTAYVFSKNCGALPYPVTGSVSGDEKTVTVSGRAPIVAADTCSIVDYRDTTDTLSFVQQDATIASAGVTKTYGDDGRLFSAGTDDYFLLSRTPQGDEDAAGYVGQVRVVHHLEGGGYEMLMKDYSTRCKAADNVLFVVWTAAGDQSNPHTVRIGHLDRTPRSSEKESYNLYWAACYEKFKKYR